MEASAEIPACRVFPNPVAVGGQVNVELSESVLTVFRLFDAQGRAVRVEQIEGSARLRLGDLPAGVYNYSVESAAFMRFGVLVVR